MLEITHHNFKLAKLSDKPVILDLDLQETVGRQCLETIFVVATTEEKLLAHSG